MRYICSICGYVYDEAVKNNINQSRQKPSGNWRTGLRHRAGERPERPLRRCWSA